MRVKIAHQPLIPEPFLKVRIIRLNIKWLYAVLMTYKPRKK